MTLAEEMKNAGISEEEIKKMKDNPKYAEYSKIIEECDTFEAAFELSEYLKNHFIHSTSTSSGASSVSEVDADLDSITSLIFLESAVDFVDPKGITIEMYDCCAGSIPVVTVSETCDFENLITNLVYKGKRPENIASIGASFISGKTIRFILLSKKPYSNVSAATMGLSEEEWKNKSMIIRREHECTHFFTKVYYGTAQNHLYDELIADFCGIYEAFGEYRAEYFEYFMGLKGTEGSRFSVYVKNASEDDVQKLKEIAKKIARELEQWSKTDEFLRMTKVERIKWMCERM